jgi:prepilin-type N-terminal cleavage/methylation domain-containing protein
MKTKILRNDKGFTLIEMAIVLVIIGLILGAVIKGKDVLNSAKQKKFYTSFIKNWELAVATYYDRTGNILGDGIVNGGISATRNGQFDWTINNAAEFVTIDTRLRAVGLENINTNTDTSWQYTYSGVYSGSRTIALDMRAAASAREGVTRNMFYFVNMPTDLALALDTMIDGQLGSSVGTFRIDPDTTTTWPAADTTPLVNVMYHIDIN